jgi:hypothetical protein
MLENFRYFKNLDLDRRQADLVRSCEQYYQLVTEKSQGYQIASDNIYNVNARGFLMGKLTQTKRIFSRTSEAPTGLQVLAEMASESG